LHRSKRRNRVPAPEAGVKTVPDPPMQTVANLEDFDCLGGTHEL
jgi:hypothetical protein